MTKCDNCDKEALYLLSDPGVNPVYFCSTCLPDWMRERASLGQLDIPKKEATKASKKKEAAEEETADESN